MVHVIEPTPDPDDTFFWDGVARDELLLQRCASCEEIRHPPLPMCPHCHATEWETAPSSGRGEVYSWIESHHPTDADGDPPRVVVLIDLAEGVRFVSNLHGIDVSDIEAGMPVELRFMTVGGVRLPQFVPAAGATS